MSWAKYVRKYGFVNFAIRGTRYHVRIDLCFWLFVGTVYRIRFSFDRYRWFSERRANGPGNDLTRSSHNCLTVLSIDFRFDFFSFFGIEYRIDLFYLFLGIEYRIVAFCFLRLSVPHRIKLDSRSIYISYICIAIFSERRGNGPGDGGRMEQPRQRLPPRERLGGCLGLVSLYTSVFPWEAALALRCRQHFVPHFFLVCAFRRPLCVHSVPKCNKRFDIWCIIQTILIFRDMFMGENIGTVFFF